VTHQDTPQAPTAPRLRWLRVEFHLWPHEQVNLLEHTGSTLRGFLKKPMRDRLCVTDLKGCERCPVLERCGYGLMWEKPPVRELRSVQKPLAAILPWPLKDSRRTFPRGQALVVSYLLLGVATELVPHLIKGMQAACDQGLGRGLARVEVRHVNIYSSRDSGATSVFAHDQGFLPYPITPGTLEVDLGATSEQTHEVLLQLHTPLHLRKPGSKRMSQEVDPQLLTRSLTRRMHHLSVQLEGVHSHQWFQPYLDWASQVRVVHDETRVETWKRWSNLQNKEVPMKGLVGRARLANVPTALLELWSWLPHIFVGKGTRHGQGYLEASALDEASTVSP
jgi:hypothetical protein